MPPVVIIGAGSSGSVLAHRLSVKREVLLLEAGPDYLPADLPRDLQDGTRNSMTAHDWSYRHRPSARTQLAPLPRGRVVGGSSAVNTCIALRGQPEDFDEWAAMGLPEWTWENCLPAFVRLERDHDFPTAPYHGSDGPLPVRRHQATELAPFQAAFLEACGELGLPQSPDSNEPGTSGYGPHAMNKVDGRRISAAEAYLTADVRARPTFQLRPDTHVRRILFHDRRVCGLEVETRGEVQRIDTEHVIVCAGALNTPAILLRSGIGPDREVRRLQCEPILDAPAVGRRLLDHPGTGIFVLAKRGVVPDRSGPIIQTVFRYSSGLCNHRADMLLQPVSFTMMLTQLPLFALVTQVGKPRGYGTLHYRTADPRCLPVIHSHFFEDEQDRVIAADALERCGRLLQTRALSKMGVAVLPWPAVLRNRRWLARFLPFLCGSGYHPCGTVPMGPRPGPDAAVDAHGAVYGVEGLHVVDASIMPTVPSSNIHLPTLMVAERMAEWLQG